jgi:hypothetical protein
LIDEGDAAEYFGCSACAYEYQLWAHIVESCGEAVYGRRAQRAFWFEDYLENFRPKLRKVSAQDYRDVEAVRAERARLQAQKEYNREQEAKQNQKP